MNDRKQALIDLRDKVKAGKTPRLVPSQAQANWPSVFSFRNVHSADDAFNGSLDAAKALHEAVLPGCGWGKVDDFVFLRPQDAALDDKLVTGQNKVPARAWLLAILEAFIAQEET